MKETLTADMLKKTFRLDHTDINLSQLSNEIIIGQPRAISALKDGFGIKSHGFNIYVAGAHGTGKLTAVQHLLKEIAEKEKTPNDWCYVYNFKEPYRPQKISLPTGKAKEFKKDMEKLIDETRVALKTTFSSENFEEKKGKIVSELKNKREDLINSLNEEARGEDLMIQSMLIGIVTIPLKKGKPLNEKELAGLNSDEIKSIEEKQKKFDEKIENFVKKSRQQEKEANEALIQMEKSSAMFAIDALIKEMKEKYHSVSDITSYLDLVEHDILDNVAMFTKEETDKSKEAANVLNQALIEDSLLMKYKVNVLVDNSETKGAPIIIEKNPIYNNLFGQVEKESKFGVLSTSFMLIRGGSLHKANGGYLIIPAYDLLTNNFSWDSLKRSLRSRTIEIEEPTDKLGFFTTKTLKPEAIPLDLKVILIDDSFIYYLLYNHDPDFKELFKIKADFDISMEFNDENVKSYISFINRVRSEEKFPPLDNAAVERIIEYSSRLAEDQDKLSTRFGKISDIVREAAYYAVQQKSEKIKAEHILQAIEKTVYRSNLMQEKINDYIKKSIIAVNLKGKKAGQINGLSVVDLGDIAFGHPVKITVNTSHGKDGIIDIERKVKLGGPIHSKGVMILSGYLNGIFGKHEVLSLSASLVFEQSYGEIEGDSASSAELYALLSSLSGLPISQGIAVTGSVNQKGDVQAIGGVNEKIEGYFEICRLTGLTGEQGVIIPATNVKNLMLKDDVVNAVKENKFRIWAVNTIDEGIEILTGVKSGKEMENGEFEEGSVKFLIKKRLHEMWEKMKEYALHPVD